MLSVEDITMFYQDKYVKTQREFREVSKEELKLFKGLFLTLNANDEKLEKS